jgi:hypothetical protein
LQHQPALGQQAVDQSKHLLGQAMGFEQVAKAQERGLVGKPVAGTVQAAELAVGRHVHQGFFHGQIRQAEPLLHEVDAQHGQQSKRRPAGPGARAVGLDQRYQLGPGHDGLHLVEEHLATGALGVELQVE